MRPRRTKKTSEQFLDHAFTLDKEVLEANRLREPLSQYRVTPQGDGGRSSTHDPGPRRPSDGFGILPDIQRRTSATDRLMRSWRSLWDNVSLDDLESMAAHAEAAWNPAPVSADKASLVSALSEGRTYSSAQALKLEIENQERYFQQRRDLLKNALTTSQVATLLGTSRQTPHDRVQTGSLLAVSEQGRLMFPSWQFDAAGPNGVVAGLPQVLRELEVPAFTKVRWLTRANPVFEGRTPLEALKGGELQRVADAARAVGVS
jgi:hypothetical protein